MWQHNKSRRGLTLVELLVAMALTVSMLALITTIFVAASGSVNTMRGITEADNKVRSAVNLLRSDLEAVYLRDAKGIRISPAQLFTAGHGPAAEGYFTIEENSPSTPVQLTYPVLPTPPTAADLHNRQGLDSYGIPVDIDTDDVIAFTARLMALSPDTTFRGRAPNGVNSNRNNVNFGKKFDEAMSVYSSFDDPLDGMFSSPIAEVAYFLRPNGRQLTQPEINAPTQQPILPATYTLYRRQLLVLSTDQAAAIERNPDVMDEINAGGFYGRFDLSVRYDDAAGVANNRKLKPNTPMSITLRKNRYGMIRQVRAADGKPRELPFVPTNTNYSTGIFVMRTGTADPNVNVWMGRPTLKESAFPGSGLAAAAFPYNRIPASPMDNTTADLTDASVDTATGSVATVGGDGQADVFGQDLGQRQGEDILLTNVVSFDVKVLDDDFLFGAGGLDALNKPVNPNDWPAVLTTVPSDAINQHQTRAVNPSAKESVDPYGPINTPLGMKVLSARPEFVDLGYLRNGANLIFDDPNTTAPLPYNYDPQAATPVDWGSQNAARWRTVGRYDPAQSVANRDPIATYDSWSTQYQLLPFPTAATNNTRIPPYERPLRAVQITLRVLEPKTNIVREFQIVHRFPN